VRELRSAFIWSIRCLCGIAFRIILCCWDLEIILDRWW
jgi:hypothetical protein